MESNKFDKQIKEKMEARIIVPSSDAWGKLEAMMVAAEKSKRSFSWLYIAASFVGLLIVSSIFFNQKESNVINKSFPIVLEKQSTNTDPEKSEEMNGLVMPSKNGNRTVVVNKVISENSIVNKVSNQLKDKEAVVSINNIYKEKEIGVVPPETKVSQYTTKNKYITPESLLVAVSNSKGEVKTTNKILEKNRIGATVDPNSLLSSVETELNQSFKESALEKFNKKFNAIKTAVVNRNYEE